MSAFAASLCGSLRTMFAGKLTERAAATVRLVVLQVLAAAAKEGVADVNDAILRSGVCEFGARPDIEQLNDALDWLADKKLVTLRRAGEFFRGRTRVREHHRGRRPQCVVRRLRNLGQGGGSRRAVASPPERPAARRPAALAVRPARPSDRPWQPRPPRSQASRATRRRTTTQCWNPAVTRLRRTLGGGCCPLTAQCCFGHTECCECRRQLLLFRRVAEAS